MTTIQNSRKRYRSVDDVIITTQSKYFVSQRMKNSANENYMKEIFDKTVDLLFQGARNINSNNEVNKCKKEKIKTICLIGDGNINFMDGGKPNGMFENRSKCFTCFKESLVKSECSNCNLNLCEYCGISCGNCSEHLCLNCVHLFECKTSNDQPCCRTCQMFT